MGYGSPVWASPATGSRLMTLASGGGGVTLLDVLGFPSLELTANAPENRPKLHQKGNEKVFQPSIFKCFGC